MHTLTHMSHVFVARVTFKEHKIVRLRCICVSYVQHKIERQSNETQSMCRFMEANTSSSSQFVTCHLWHVICDMWFVQYVQHNIVRWRVIFICVAFHMCDMSHAVQHRHGVFHTCDMCDEWCVMCDNRRATHSLSMDTPLWTLLCVYCHDALSIERHCMWQ